MNRSWKNYYWSKENKCFTDGKNKLLGANKWFKKYIPEFDIVKISSIVAKKSGKTSEEVREEWEDKKNFAIKRGNACHDYIKAKIRGSSYWKDDYLSYYKDVIDDKLKEYQKKGFIPFLVEDNISAYGILSKPDLVLYHPESDTYLIIDWKFVDRFKSSNSFQSLHPPFSFLASCHHGKYLAVGELYSLILAKEYNIDESKINSVVINFSCEEKTYDIKIRTYFLRNIVKREVRKYLHKEFQNYKPEQLPSV
tara:strand:+ start:16873 stop:17628 length:756 start_codon:yes stop_codon:yes gene_type:complete